jgi:hypothetical protein
LICDKNDKGIETKTKGKRVEKRAAEEKHERAAQVEAKE